MIGSLVFGSAEAGAGAVWQVLGRLAAPAPAGALPNTRQNKIPEFFGRCWVVWQAGAGSFGRCGAHIYDIFGVISGKAKHQGTYLSPRKLV